MIFDAFVLIIAASAAIFLNGCLIVLNAAAKTLKAMLFVVSYAERKASHAVVRLGDFCEYCYEDDEYQEEEE